MVNAIKEERADEVSADFGFSPKLQLMQ